MSDNADSDATDVNRRLEVLEQTLRELQRDETSRSLAKTQTWLAIFVFIATLSGFSYYSNASKVNDATDLAQERMSLMETRFQQLIGDHDGERIINVEFDSVGSVMSTPIVDPDNLINSYCQVTLHFLVSNQTDNTTELFGETIKLPFPIAYRTPYSTEPFYDYSYDEFEDIDERFLHSFQKRIFTDHVWLSQEHASAFMDHYTGNEFDFEYSLAYKKGGSKSDIATVPLSLQLPEEFIGCIETLSELEAISEQPSDTDQTNSQAPIVVVEPSE